MPGDAPTVIMEMAFETDPLTRPDDGDWTVLTDAGDDTVLISWLKTRRGARTVTGQIVPGSASASIDYPGRVLEPFYDGSPWFPNVDLRKRVRWSIAGSIAEDISDGGDADPALPDISDGGDADPALPDISDGAGSGGGHAVWTGFISRLPNGWRLEVASVNLEAVGLLSLVGGVPLPPSVIYAVMQGLEPDAWWILGDSQTRADDVMGPADGNFTLAPSTVNPGVVPWGSIASTRFTPPTDTVDGQRMKVGSLPWPGHQRSVVFWLRTPTLNATADVPLWAQISGGNVWRLAITEGRLRHILLEGSDGIEQIGSFTFGNDVDAHLVVATVDADSEEFLLYVDGDLAVLDEDNETGTADYVALVESLAPAVLGYDPAATALAGVDGIDIDLGHLAVFNRVLSPAEVASIWEAGSYAWDGDTTGERLNRILDLAGVDPDDRDIDTGTQVCGPAVLGGTVGAYVAKIAQTEGGPIFELATGEIALRERTVNNPTPALVFSDDPDGDGGTPYEPVAMDYSTTRLINTAVAARDGSSVSVTVVNEASVATYGTASQSATTLHATIAGARSVASRMVIRNSRPRLMVDGITVSSRHSDEVPTEVSLDTDVAAVATLFARPPGGGDPVEQLLVVESVEQSLVGNDWTTAFGVFEHIVLPCFSWDVPGAGWDESAWC